MDQLASFDVDDELTEFLLLQAAYQQHLTMQPPSPDQPVQCPDPNQATMPEDQFEQDYPYVSYQERPHGSSVPEDYSYDDEQAGNPVGQTPPDTNNPNYMDEFMMPRITPGGSDTSSTNVPLPQENHTTFLEPTPVDNVPPPLYENTPVMSMADAVMSSPMGRGNPQSQQNPPRGPQPIVQAPVFYSNENHVLNTSPFSSASYANMTLEEQYHEMLLQQRYYLQRQYEEKLQALFGGFGGLDVFAPAYTPNGTAVQNTGNDLRHPVYPPNGHGNVLSSPTHVTDPVANRQSNRSPQLVETRNPNTSLSHSLSNNSLSNSQSGGRHRQASNHSQVWAVRTNQHPRISSSSRGSLLLRNDFEHDWIRHKYTMQTRTSATSMRSAGFGRSSLTSAGSFQTPLLKLFTLVIRVCWNVIITSECVALFFTSILVFVGQLGQRSDLAGVALGITITNMFGQTFLMGMSSSFGTLCQRAWNAQEYKLLGIFLQRTIALSHLLLFFIIGLFFFSDTMLRFLGQDREATKKAVVWITIFMVALWPIAMSLNLRRYLEAQVHLRVVMPAYLIALACEGLGLFLFTKFPGKVSVVVASGIAICVAYWTLLLVLVFQIWFKKLHLETWPGCSFRQLGVKFCVMVKLGAAETIVLCSEWWAFEILTLIAGVNGLDQLVSFAITLNIVTILVKFSYGVSFALSVMVHHGLRRHLPIRFLKYVWNVCIVASVLFSFFVALALYFGRTTIVGLFIPHDPDVKTETTDAMYLVCFYYFIDAYQRCCEGALRGMDRTKWIGGVKLFGYYMIGIPLAAWLSTVNKMRVKGIWFGLIAASLTCAIILTIVRVFRLQWDIELTRSSHREHRQKRDPARLRRAFLSVSKPKLGSHNQRLLA